MSLTNFVKGTQDIMRMDAGINGDAQRIEQLVWVLFLKMFDVKEEEWELEDDYKAIIPKKYQWRNWAANDEGITGEELLEFVESMFKDLKNLEVSADTDPRKALIKDFFEDSHNYMKSGTLLRQLLNKINEIELDDYEERHAFNDIYESILKDLQSAGNAGEYYTPRAVTDFIIDRLDPRIGDKVGDFACGTGGFLVSALNHMKKMRKKENTGDMEILGRSIYGIEKKPMPHMLCLTNMILHDVDTPNVRHDNGLAVKVREIPASEKMDIIAMNPPFGGSEEEGIKKNFPNDFMTSETADLFMTRIMYQLKDRGRAGVVLPDGFLFGEGVKTNIKKKLLEEFNLHTIVRMPNGVFAPYTGINTNLLFFDKGTPTKDVWFFEHPLPKGYKNYTKTKPIKLSEFDLEKEWWNERKGSEYAWKVSAEDIAAKNYNLDFKNPTKEEVVYGDPQEVLERYNATRDEIKKLKEMLKSELEMALKGE
ncbi:restriction endonuclease EcoEI subunit M [Propionigenium maris DSM 9537]|uniref:site-specific DNA-methyltransferase (adenine-specific) n=1 Tax=Propionigenium maris DSM 9537 TaxID=1123000 RepID=A0A9W6LNV5_9FUSO|nr:class I SAM-dependent DNA methyltransferase [Propionigenium maris]GLI57319.1 restriction endonuclease EcoEI subunit M [Propionigenium maris DSM 9537]